MSTRRFGPGGTPPPRPRVLIAEDDEALKDSLVEALRQDGYAAIAVEDATGLIALAAATREGALPELIIADLRAPGFEVVRLLESLPRQVLWGTPIIVVSHDASSETAERARRIGSAVVVPRPLGADELRELARALLPPPRPDFFDA